MKEGFVVAELNEESGSPIGFWNGSVFVDSLNEAAFYPTKVDGKYAFGYAQAGYADKEISLLPAVLEVRLFTSEKSNSSLLASATL